MEFKIMGYVVIWTLDRNFGKNWYRIIIDLQVVLLPVRHVCYTPFREFVILRS
jgi:hypothetical protein